MTRDAGRGLSAAVLSFFMFATPGLVSFASAQTAPASTTRAVPATLPRLSFQFGGGGAGSSSRPLKIKFDAGLGPSFYDFGERACNNFTDALPTFAPVCAVDDGAFNILAGVTMIYTVRPHAGIAVSSGFDWNGTASFENVATGPGQKLFNRGSMRANYFYAGVGPWISLLSGRLTASASLDLIRNQVSGEQADELQVGGITTTSHRVEISRGELTYALGFEFTTQLPTIDEAAMEVFLKYRRFEMDDLQATGNPARVDPTGALATVTAGARITF